MNANAFYSGRERPKKKRRCVVCGERWPQNGRFCATCEKFTDAERRKIAYARELTIIEKIEREKFAPPVVEPPLEPIYTRTINGVEFDVMFDGSCK
jgi:predicted nucleic acid-binding Zn ribbon protein